MVYWFKKKCQTVTLSQRCMQLNTAIFAVAMVLLSDIILAPLKVYLKKLELYLSSFQKHQLKHAE